MWFFIGILVFIIFCIVVYFYFKVKIKLFLNKMGIHNTNLGEIIKEARLEDQELPKSLSSMDSIYLEQIKHDFPDLNINELKRKAEKVILDCYNSINNKDISMLNGKIKSFAQNMIDDYSSRNIKLSSFKIHNTVVSSYKKDKGVATIYFGTSFEYFKNEDGKNIKVQDRAKTEFIYVIDDSKIEEDIKVLGLHCPNCGSPINSLNEEKCGYCGSTQIKLIGKVFSCNDIVSY